MVYEWYDVCHILKFAHHHNFFVNENCCSTASSVLIEYRQYHVIQSAIVGIGNKRQKLFSHSLWYFMLFNINIKTFLLCKKKKTRHACINDLVYIFIFFLSNKSFVQLIISNIDIVDVTWYILSLRAHHIKKSNSCIKCFKLLIGLRFKFSFERHVYI